MSTALFLGYVSKDCFSGRIIFLWLSEQVSKK